MDRRWLQRIAAEESPKIRGSEMYFKEDSKASGTADPPYQERLLLKYTRFACLKASAAAMRFIVEDCIQMVCAGIYLIKRWLHMSSLAKGFTFVSILTGFLSCLVGVVVAGVGWRRARAEAAVKKVVPEKLWVAVSNSRGETYWAPRAHLSSLAAADQFEDHQLTAPQPLRSKAINSQTISSQPTTYLLPAAWRRHVGPEAHGVETGHAEDLDPVARRRSKRKPPYSILAIASALFWGMMAVLLFVVEGFECDHPAPRTSHILGCFATLWTIWAEFRYVESVPLSCWSTCSGLALSLLARFDTYSDVVTYRMLASCEPITWFTIGDFAVSMGVRLDKVSFIALMLGVGLCQALPSMVLLLCRSGVVVPLTLKLGDFNLALAGEQTLLEQHLQWLERRSLFMPGEMPEEELGDSQADELEESETGDLESSDTEALVWW